MSKLEELACARFNAGVCTEQEKCCLKHLKDSISWYAADSFRCKGMTDAHREEKSIDHQPLKLLVRVCQEVRFDEARKAAKAVPKLKKSIKRKK